jgi:hypothetical protein
LAVKIESSFSRLFRQSRYARGDEQNQSKQNRRELFAVAAVAFVAKHDENFARNFLRHVAGVPPGALHHDFRWEPQRAFCADLLITDCESDEQYIVEFKVGARLMEKQNSGSTEFERTTGYGRAIRDQFPKTKVYTALAQQRDFEDSEKNGLQRHARTWKELIPTNGRETPLVEDLLDSLGDLGISVLRLRKIKQMKNAPHVDTTINIHDVLKTVLSEFSGKPALDIDRDDLYDWVGMYVRPRPKQHADLRKWLGHNWSYIGWIGYLLPKDGKGPQLSVWLSFREDLTDRRNQSIQVLRKVIKGADVEPSPKNNDLIVKIPAKGVTDEKEWFTETLDIVLNNSVPRSVKS